MRERWRRLRLGCCPLWFMASHSHCPFCGDDFWANHLSCKRHEADHSIAFQQCREQNSFSLLQCLKKNEYSWSIYLRLMSFQTVSSCRTSKEGSHCSFPLNLMRYHAQNAAKDTNEAVKHIWPALLHIKTMKMQRRIQKRVLFERPLMHFYSCLWLLEDSSHSLHPCSIF